MTGFKTLLFGALVTLFGFLETFDFTTVTDGDTAGYITIGIGVAIKVLRMFTSTPMGKAA